MQKGTPDYYSRWRQWIREWQPKLPDNIDRATLIAFCYVLADCGFNGTNCYVGNLTLARYIGRSRNTLKPYREFAIEQGIFVKTGGRKGRVEVLEVNIPDCQPSNVCRYCGEHAELHDYSCNHCGGLYPVSAVDSG